MTTNIDTYAAPRAMIEAAISQFNVTPEKAETLRFRHEMDVRADPTTGTITYANGVSDTSAWLRTFAVSTPGILPPPDGALAPTPSAPVASRDWKSASLTELSAGIKTGSQAAQQEFTRRVHDGSRTPGQPRRSGVNLTELMIAAKKGDLNAIEKLKNLY